MRRVLAFAACCALLLAFAVSPAVVNAGRGGPETTTYPSVTCFVDAPEFEMWTTGFGDQVEHGRAVFINDLWVYDGSWRMVGTETDRVMDVANTRTGTELFRGSWVLTGSLGDFAGTFMWTENRSGAGGVTVGHATDGSGLLWKATPAVVDPDTTGGVPACAVDREVHDLTLVEIIAP